MFKWLRRKSATTSAQLYQMLGLERATWFSQHYTSYAREGYIKNCIAFHCIKEIAKAASNIPYYLKVGEDQPNEHEVLKLLKRPNLKQGYNKFMKELLTYQQIAGQSYIYMNTVSGGKVMEMTNLRPDRVSIRTTSYSVPIAYDYDINGQVYSYPIDPVTFESEVLHIKEIHPTDDLYGLSPVQAAAMPIDQHNESAEWNKKLLENSARPTGILSLKDRGDGTILSADQLKDLREQIEEKLSGYKNAGKPLVVTAEMVWQSMGLSPADMDWLQGRQAVAREICLAFGYPALLLGFPEGSTFNNVAEAKLALYEDTVIPLLQSTLQEFSSYFSRRYKKQDIEICVDLDKVPALAPRRELTRKNAREDMIAGLITPNEAREEIGYKKVDGGDELLVPAGKLPLNFDLDEMDQTEFEKYLRANGFNEKFIKELSEKGYSS